MTSQTSSNEDSPDQLHINLQIVSPSVGVNRPLQFPATPASTTIKQLKGMIRNALPIRPVDEHQRLIYRGKALAREGDSLLEILGAESTRTTDLHTIHLVLRDVEQPPAPTPTVPHTTSAGRQPFRPADAFFEQFPTRPPVPSSGLHTAQQTQPHTQPRMPSPAPLAQQFPPPAAAAFQQQHQQMTSWLNQVQRDAMSRAIVNQNQRGRAQAGMRGIADTTRAGSSLRDSSSRRGSPAPTHTIYRETQGPNGQSYHVETVIRSSTQSGPLNGTYSIADIQNLVRGADSGQGTSTMGAAMQRTASGASLPTRSAPTLLNMASAPQQGSQPRQGLDLYLLSSPDGPRGILINNSTMETFYTPRGTAAPHAAATPGSPMTVRQWLLTPPDAQGYEDPFGDILEQPQEHPRHRLYRTNVRQNQAPNPAAAAVIPAQAPAHVHPPAAAPVQVQGVMPAMPQPVHGRNPMAGFGQLLVRMAPHIWNIARLGLFVWLFVGPNSSWTRWFVVVSAAIFVFVLGTGALNGMGEHFWRPILRHLESLFPTLDRPQQPRTAAAPTATDTNPTPQELAARLVADHNARRPWLSEQLRRVERAGLLFLASIAPGVAERHIANLEEEARQEQRRQREAEEAAAAAAAEAERLAKENAKNTGEGGEEPEAGPSPAELGTSRHETSDAAIENSPEQAPARQSLVTL